MTAMRAPRIARTLTAGLAAASAWLVAAAPVMAHGPAPDEPPSAANLLLGWAFPPLPTLGILAALAWWIWATGRVRARHPDTPVPRRRTLAWVGGMAALAWALLSGIERYDTTLFSVHMVQHLLLTLVAAPLIAYSAPITLLLRVSSSETRKRWILPVLHSRPMRALTHPVVAWILFAGVMWVSHFSPLFDAALEDPLIHELEHALFLGTALLFWWPAVAADPSPWRMSHPVRALYTFTQMPQNTFLAVVILNASEPLYEHYATIEAAWAIDPLGDQRLAAGIMWVGGDFLFIAAVAAIVIGWMRREEADTARADRRAEVEMAAIRARSEALAAGRVRGAVPPGTPDTAPGPRSPH
jgi:putative membrane protein